MACCTFLKQRLNFIDRLAAPLVATFDGWGFVLMVSGDFPHVKFGFLPPIDPDRDATA
jgi:hypothetical protein